MTLRAIDPCPLGVSPNRDPSRMALRATLNAYTRRLAPPLAVKCPCRGHPQTESGWRYTPATLRGEITLRQACMAIVGHVVTTQMYVEAAEVQAQAWPRHRSVTRAPGPEPDGHRSGSRSRERVAPQRGKKCHGHIRKKVGRPRESRTAARTRGH